MPENVPPNEPDKTRKFLKQFWLISKPKNALFSISTPPAPRHIYTLQSVLLWLGKVSSRKRKKSAPYVKLDCQKPWEISIVILFGLLKKHSGELYTSRGGVEQPISMHLWTLECIRAVLQNVFHQTSCLFQKVYP